ncbi:MAG: glycosyltransferase family 2 protein, partial [Candidatus Aenigmarchaeota archaeon]|nr:glycosyltransferase family 2 protein [Candidatus Aenigmarchaeota archaeon]
MIIAVMPGKDVEKFVNEIVKKTLGYVDRVIFVDDGYSDRSGDEAESAGAYVIKFPRNFGKGTALRSGFEKALELGASVIITLDSDGQHKPEEIPILLGEIEK